MMPCIRHHITRKDWLLTKEGLPRGYIQPQSVRELWFHTGTICNLSCPFCLEGSKPGDDRLQKMTLEDVKPFMVEAGRYGVRQFSFTGGEPFVVKDIVSMLDFALDRNPCLVLTNGTDPLWMRRGALKPFLQKPHPVGFRISLDFPDPDRHDASRGCGSFWKAMKSLKYLHDEGFSVSIARHVEKGENSKAVERAYRKYFKRIGIPKETCIVSFPDFMPPGSNPEIPQITETCMTRYVTEEQRQQFMCTHSKMIVKKNDKMRVYACTLVDDDDDYDLGGSLKESADVRVMLKHHRCYACFAYGASCSEVSPAQM